MLNRDDNILTYAYIGQLPRSAAQIYVLQVHNIHAEQESFLAISAYFQLQQSNSSNSDSASNEEISN